MYDFLKANNQDCLVVSPNSIPKPACERVKNNRIDSETIVQQLKSNNLTSIRVPEGPYRELRHLIKTREYYTQLRIRARQRIKALLLFEHLYDLIKDPGRNWSNRYFGILRKLPCSNETVRFKLDKILEDHDYAIKQLLNMHRQIKDFIQKHVEMEKSVTVPITFQSTE